MMMPQLLTLQLEVVVLLLDQHLLELSTASSIRR